MAPSQLRRGGPPRRAATATALAAAAGSLRLAAAVTKGLHSEEAAAYDFFGKTTPHGQPQQVPRYASVTPQQFEKLALDGRPFVIEDGGKDQPFVGWSCDRFQKEYPNGVVNVEYVRSDKTVRSMKDDWQNEKHKIPKADPDGPQYAPWYWGVKGANDEEEASTVYSGSKKQNPLPKVQSLMRTPAYVRNSSENRREILHSPEFWFSAPGAGAQMHMDSHCESTIVIQLSGKRKWKLGWAPPVPDGQFFEEGTYGDGQIYGKGYHPPLEADVSEGQALFFPSAFLHSTINVGETCAASLTFQIREPVPARYFRHSMKHLMRTDDFGECWGLMGQAASSAQPNINQPPDQGKLSPKVDKDNDGVFSFAEAKTRLHRATHTFYDVDGDGMVTQTEAAEGWAAWNDLLKAANKVKKKQRQPKNFHYIAKREEL